jgi:SulP family sulfate permease
MILAAIGLIESLLTLNLVGEITNKRGRQPECIAQGVANTITGFFGGMGGCAMIGQSINVKSGGRTRIAGTLLPCSCWRSSLFASGLIRTHPLAALVGVMFMVVIGTFAWNSFKIMTKVPVDAFVIVRWSQFVTVMTTPYDGRCCRRHRVCIGLRMVKRQTHLCQHEITEDGAKVYKIGPLFFGSADGFGELWSMTIKVRYHRF